jgi:DNA-directed RNA polymerase sigma subunit (sigma70/sigma32)
MARPIDYPYHMTHQEIADQLGISRVRVRQLETSAIKKLHDRLILRQYYLDHVSSSSESRNQDHIPFV